MPYQEEETTLSGLDEITGEEIVFEKVKIRYPDGSQLQGDWILMLGCKSISKGELSNQKLNTFIF